jgi:hypothetical protein
VNYFFLLPLLFPFKKRTGDYAGSHLMAGKQFLFSDKH